MLKEKLKSVITEVINNLARDNKLGNLKSSDEITIIIEKPKNADFGDFSINNQQKNSPEGELIFIQPASQQGLPPPVRRLRLYRFARENPLSGFRLRQQEPERPGLLQGQITL